MARISYEGHHDDDDDHGLIVTGGRSSAQLISRRTPYFCHQRQCRATLVMKDLHLLPFLLSVRFG